LLKFQENKKIKPIDDVWKTRTVLFAIIYGCEFALLANVEIGDLHSGRRQPEERLAVANNRKQNRLSKEQDRSFLGPRPMQRVQLFAKIITSPILAEKPGRRAGAPTHIHSLTLKK
jgi:hypothetical protein